MESWRIAEMAGKWSTETEAALGASVAFEVAEEGVLANRLPAAFGSRTALMVSSQNVSLETADAVFEPGFVVELTGGLASEYVAVIRCDQVAGDGGTTVLFDGEDPRFLPVREWFLDGADEGRRDGAPGIICGTVAGGLRAVLSVFFRDASVAVVDRGVWQTAITRNPQVGNELEIVRRSPPIYGGVVFVRRGLPGHERRLLEEILLGMGETAPGKQLLRRMKWKAVHRYPERSADGAPGAGAEGQFPLGGVAATGVSKHVREAASPDGRRGKD
jgi:hypothetical protein